MQSPSKERLHAHLTSAQGLAQAGLALLLVVSAGVVSFSTLLAPFARLAWPAVFGGCLAALVFLRLVKGRHISPQELLSLAALQALLAAGITQVMAANALPSGLQSLHALPGGEWAYLLLGTAAASGLTWLSLAQAAGGPGLAALAGAGLYSSVIFFRVSAVTETGYAYSLLAGFALLALMGIEWGQVRIPRAEAAFWMWTLAFLLALGVSMAASPVPNQSLSYTVYLVVMVSLAVLAAFQLRAVSSLRQAAWGVVALGAGLPAVFAALKAASIVSMFGLTAGLAYRLHPTEMGGANLIARSLLASAPLVAALLLAQPAGPGRKRRQVAGLLLVQAGLLGIILYARSFEGFFAYWAGMGVFALLAGWQLVRAYGQRVSAKPLVLAAHIIAGILLAGAILVAGVRAGYAANPYSFNGRIAHWVGAVDAWREHPVLGGGPDNEYLYAHYAGRLTVVGEAQQFIDDPLYVIRYRAGLLRVHAHNLLLETAAFTGLLGVVTAAGMLAALLWLGIKTFLRAEAGVRLLAAGCLAGIAGELAWGLLDVIRETPPFFSFPIWALVGLLLAAGRSVSRKAAAEVDDLPAAENPAGFRRRGAWVQWAALGLALAVVLLPSIAGNRYGAGFLAFQEHRWEEAARNFRAAAALNPLSHQYSWMLSKTELELGEWERAGENLGRAVSLKRGFSPYLAQAGWLAWLQGDLEAAEAYFLEAAANDPLEAWTNGLYANLGLLRVYQGRPGEAAAYFAQSLEYRPELAAAPYWVTVRQADGSNQVVLSPDYSPSGDAAALNARLRAHLGMADVSTRHFSRPGGSTASLALPGVLELLHEKYQRAAGEADANAHLILAAEAEAARMAGLFEQAADAYLAYQAARPGSAYGYRDLATVYQARGWLSEAQAMLEKAVEVSPRNTLSYRLLANLQVEQGQAQEAAATLRKIKELAAQNTFHFSLFNTDLLHTQIVVGEATGDAAGVQDALHALAYIRGLADDYMRLAESTPHDQAAGYCWLAVEDLFKRWARAYDSRLWEAAGCIAASEETPGQVARRLEAYRSPFLSRLLAGHIAFRRGDLEAAVEAYTRAAQASPGEGGPHYFLGEVYQALGEPDLAARHYRMAADLSSLESLPLLSLGRLHMANGDSGAALAAFEEAVERTPGWSEAHIYLANLLLARGENSRADDHYQAARQLENSMSAEPVIDLITRLAGAEFSDSFHAGYIKGEYFDLNGDRKRTIFMHPTSWARYTLSLPPVSPEEHLALRFDIGLSPGSWTQPGDGVTFSVELDGGSGSTVVFEQYLDPKANPADRRWRQFSLDLDAYAGQQVTLTLKTSPGPAHDDQFDWAGWGDPHIVLHAVP